MKELADILLETIRCALDENIYIPVNYKPESDANLVLNTGYVMYLTYKPLKIDSLTVYIPSMGSIIFGGYRENVRAIEDDLGQLTRFFVGVLDRNIGSHELESCDESERFLWKIGSKRVYLQFNKNETELPYLIIIENNLSDMSLDLPFSQ